MGTMFRVLVVLVAIFVIATQTGGGCVDMSDTTTSDSGTRIEQNGDGNLVEITENADGSETTNIVAESMEGVE